MSPAYQTALLIRQHVASIRHALLAAQGITVGLMGAVALRDLVAERMTPAIGGTLAARRAALVDLPQVCATWVQPCHADACVRPVMH